MKKKRRRKMKEQKWILSEYESVDRIADTARIFSRREGGIGEGFGEGVILCSRRKMYEEATALARYLKRISGDAEPSVLLVDGGMYDASIVTVACSMLGCTLTLSEAFPEAIPECSIMIAPHRPAAENGQEYSFVAISELNAIVLGELSAEDNEEKMQIAPSDDNCLLLQFLRSDSDGGTTLESYSEYDAVMIAEAYARAEGVFPWDVLYSTLHPCSKEGFFGGLLAPMLTAKKWVYSPYTPLIFEQMRLCAPTKLLCDVELAQELLSEMRVLKVAPKAWQKGRGSHPLRLKLDRLFPRTRAALRRLKMIYVHYPFGGKLSGVITKGELSADAERGFLEFGVLSSSILTADNCPLAGFRKTGDRVGFWRLPKYLCADMCNVDPFGHGTIILWGGGLSENTPNGHTFKAGEFREENEKNAWLVSDLFGFSTRKGTFFVKKRLFL